MLRRSPSVLVLLGASAAAGSASAEPLAGEALDSATLQPVAGATVSADEVGETETDAAGRFLLEVPEGEVVLQVSAEGYAEARVTVEVPAGGLRGYELYLVPDDLTGEGEVIEIEGEGPRAPPDPPGRQDLKRKEITRLPGSQGDALASLKSLPGVANADGAGSGPGLLVIRGAAPEDSVISIDGIEVPILYHFFGLQSILPSEFIETIDFQPGGFGAERGRATGGVIDIKTRSVPPEGYKGFAELSFINFAGYFEGPLWEEEELYLRAGIRRSVIDGLVPLAVPDDAELSFTTAPRYYDGQVRVDWIPDADDRVSLLGLVSFDLLRVVNDEPPPNEPLLDGAFENETRFTRAIATWEHDGDRLDSELTASAGTTNLRVQIGSERFLRVDGMRLDLREDATLRLGERLDLRAGGDARLASAGLRALLPLPPSEGNPPENFSTAPVLDLDEEVDNHAAGAYLAIDFRPTPETTITPGVRYDYYDRISEDTVSPRLQLTQDLGDAWTARLALGAYSRPLQQTELLDRTLKPEIATQYVAGADYRIAEGIKASGSVFYTDRRQLVVQDEALAETMPRSAYVNRGYGRSFGLEGLVRARLDRFFGWVAYTLSRSDRIDGPGKPRRLFGFDQTHNFIVVGSYRLGDWQLGGRWQYNTGQPNTPVVGSVYLADFNVYVPVYGEVNSERLDATHQLDLRVDRRWDFGSWDLSFFLDVTNVYANPATLGVAHNFDYSERQEIEELPIVPALGVRGSF